MKMKRYNNVDVLVIYLKYFRSLIASTTMLIRHFIYFLCYYIQGKTRVQNTKIEHPYQCYCNF